MTPLHFAFFPSSPPSSSKEGFCFYGASKGKEEEEAGIDTLPLFSFGAFKVPDTPFPTHSRERKKYAFFRNYGFETVLSFEGKRNFSPFLARGGSSLVIIAVLVFSS